MGGKTRVVARGKASQRKGLAVAKLDELVEEATVDAHDESEQTTGFYTMFEEHLALPFKTEVLGVEVTVERIDITDDEQIITVCARGKSRRRIPITESPTRVRAELASGDLRALYIAWPGRAQGGELEDEDAEPPCLPGLGKLSRRWRRLPPSCTSTAT